MCVCMCARSGPWQPWEWAALTSFQERTRFERQGELTAPRGHNFRLPQHPHWDHALPGCPNKDCVQRGTRATHFSSLYWTSFALQPCEGSDPQSSTTVWTSSLHILGLAISPLTGVDQHCGLMFFPLTAFPCLLIPCRLFHQKFLGLLILSWHRLPGEFTLTQWVLSSRLIFFCISKRRRKFG